MIENHSTPPDLKSNSMEELHRQRMAAKPDAWTMAWLKSKFEEITKAYFGVCHMLNVVIGMCRDYREKQEGTEKEVAELRTELQAANVRIGELQVELGSQQQELAAVKKRFEDMSTWAAKIDKQLGNKKRNEGTNTN